MQLVNAAARDSDDPKPGFSQQTRRMLTAMRVVAYSLATIFMIVMVFRGVWLTQDQMEDAAVQSAVAAAAALEPMANSGSLNRQSAAPVFTAIAPLGAGLELATRQPGSSINSTQSAVQVGDTQHWVTVTIDRSAIRDAAWRSNLPYIILVSALGTPVILIFLVMGWLVNQPALKLLAYAQSRPDEDQWPPELPALWARVLERLKQLRTSQVQMQAFLDNAPVPMAFINRSDLKVVMINRCSTDLFGIDEADLMAMEAGAFASFFPDFAEVLEVHLAKLLDRKQTVVFETPFRRPSGKTLPLLITAFPVIDRGGGVELVGFISMDLTHERQAQADLARSSSALHQSEKLAALGSMLAGVSHELNNPLAAVIGQAALLAEDLEHSVHLERITKIRRAADRCARIVQSFLAMARQKEPEYRSVAIADQINAAMELTEYQMRSGNVRIVLDLQPNLPSIKADPDQLHQVIVNLLTNARQALEEVHGERIITVNASRKGQRIRLVVADNGSGIDEATRDRIFDPFFTTKAVGSGTGIGLSFSLGIIEAHGGTLTIEDRPVGTAFAITLPVESKPEETTVALAAVPDAAKGKALVIDDELDVAETLADMLQRMGMNATVAIGGLAGQAAMASGDAYDIVLSDIRMPDCDGATLFSWIGANRPDLSDRIGFVTGDTLSGAAAGFIATAGRPVLEKPFTPAALRDLVSQILDR